MYPLVMPFAPYAHQVQALDKMRGKPAFALLMAMRTGKSKVILDEWVADGMPDLLVVAPAGAYRTWETELAKHVVARHDSATWVSADGFDSVADLFGSHGPRVMIANVEAYSSARIGLREISAEFLASRTATLVIDESTTIKSMSSKRGKAIRNLAKLAKKRRILSGLPTPRSPLDLYGQFEFLDHSILNFVSYKAFMHRYAITRKMKVGAFWIDIVTGYRNLEELWQKIEPYSFRVRLEDCADVPPKLYLTREVALSSEQRRIYDQMKRYATAQLSSGEHVTSSQVITTMLRLHQICCGRVVDEEGNAHEIDSSRLQTLMSLLDECDGKVLIWCSYAADLRAISASLRLEYGQDSVAEFWGGNRPTREQESKRFREEPSCSFMVATPGSGGRGRTWPEAKTMIYYSSIDNLEHRDQSEERASAVDQVDRVTVIDMIARGTVEELILQALRKKMDLAAIITNDNWREWVI